ncbi:MAG: hypothetical protein ACRC37_01550, partial [Lentisphaeria bacterium]
MKVEPKFKGPILLTAHPVGCEQSVIEQINYVKN